MPYTTTHPKGSPTFDLFDLGVRFRQEFLKEAGISWDDVAKYDPQEMAMFGFLVGAGVPWTKARMVENLDLGDEPSASAREDQRLLKLNDPEMSQM